MDNLTTTATRNSSRNTETVSKSITIVFIIITIMNKKRHSSTGKRVIFILELNFCLLLRLRCQTYSNVSLLGILPVLCCCFCASCRTFEFLTNLHSRSRCNLLWGSCSSGGCNTRKALYWLLGFEKDDGGGRGGGGRVSKLLTAC